MLSKKTVVFFWGGNQNRWVILESKAWQFRLVEVVDGALATLFFVSASTEIYSRRIGTTVFSNQNFENRATCARFGSTRQHDGV